MNLHRIVGPAFFVAAILLLIADNAGLGAAFIALGVVFMALDSQQESSSQE